MIQEERIQRLNAKPVRRGRYVLYWMQASQREHCNHALEYAAERANELGEPLVACFGLTDDYPHANARHYAFMLDGLVEVREALARRGVSFVVQRGAPAEVAQRLGAEASVIVTDRGYLEHQRAWRREVARQAKCLVVQVESDVVAPVETASRKEEYAAATLRPKIHRQLERFLVPLRRRRLRRDSLGLKFESLDVSDPADVLASLGVDRSVSPGKEHHGGSSEAQKRLDEFCDRRLARYDTARNDPTQEGTSDLSPYLHFGQISPLHIALQVRKRSGAGAEAFLEELIVRRELSMNFVTYCRAYLSPTCLPAWARATLRKHAKDKREYTYSRRELEGAATHDPYWNAAQEQMRLTGKMHGYMRMYWGKKILEWSPTPLAAYQRCVYLNDKYELDGRDPNGYAGIAWCFGKHDRPWQERPVFGTVRYMNANGLRRKFDADAYVRQIEQLSRESQG